MLLTNPVCAADALGGAAGEPAAPETTTSTHETAARATPARRPPRPQSAFDLFPLDLVPSCRMTLSLSFAFLHMAAAAAEGHVKLG
jgi:hypothetical protein